MLGFSSWPEFDGAVEELRDTIERQQPLSELDWTRVLVLTEIAWASDVLGAGLDFELVSGVRYRRRRASSFDPAQASFQS